jgi:hypothetical protein
MTVLYENRQRAKRARVAILASLVWTAGCFYWAYVLHSGGSRPGLVALVALVGLLPQVALYFYSSVYVVRLTRDGDLVEITTLGLFQNQTLRVPVASILEVARPEAAGMTMRVAGRQMPFMLDMHAEHGDLNAIAALAGKASSPTA